MTIESPIQTDGGNAANNGATVSSTTIAEMDGNGQSMDAEVSSPVVVALKRKQDAATPIVEVCSAEASGVDSAVAVAAESAQAHVEKESAAKKLKLDDESTKEAEATTASSSSAEPSKELEMTKPGQEAANQAETEAEDDESIYPDTEEFYAWMVTGGESGAFLASHRVSTVDTAIPAAQKLVELNITNIIPTEDQEHCEKDEKEGDANGRIRYIRPIHGEVRFSR
ncbi:hypothetical protein DFJ73DRAFT_40454 [Zopfochytrium polystomum]|nr:hypothetical protein DFJ73DRAFT_40454 [Zopfochytrium polystomum]